MPGMDLTTHQARFHQRWPDLRDPHVRALAWLLYAPDLLAPEAACWDGRVATLGQLSPEVAGWLHDLQYDQAMNAALHAHLAQQPSGRLGRYAEKLLGFYLRQQGCLVAANLQVRNQSDSGDAGRIRFPGPIPRGGKRCRRGALGVRHQVLSLAGAAARRDGAGDAFCRAQSGRLAGPQDAQDHGSAVEAFRTSGAQAVLPAPVVAARALVKGWLFYPLDAALSLPPAMGIAAEHCRGFWCDAAALPGVDDGTTGYADLAAPVLVGAGSPASRAVHAAGATVGPVGRNVHG
jgi:hypothetical protein